MAELERLAAAQADVQQPGLRIDDATAMLFEDGTLTINEQPIPLPC